MHTTDDLPKCAAPRCLSIRRLLLAGAAAVMLVPQANAEPLALPEPITDADYDGDGHWPEAQVRLGNLLFFDKVLSGNRNVSCATCHHPDHATSDGLPLGLGEGGAGLGPMRSVPEGSAVLGRVPRNSPALFNLAAREYDSMFHDGRLAKDPDGPWPSGYWSPAREDLPEGLDTLLAAQAMFPVTSHVEMAGAQGDNPIGDAAALGRLSGNGGVWDLLAERLREIPGYVALFRAAFPEIESAEDITFVHAARAIAAFEATAFRADDSPFDRVLATGETDNLSPEAQVGMALFYGEAGCATCHSGKFQTDQAFHAIGMPQIGPGKGDGFAADYWEATGYVARLEDYGRQRVTRRAEDRFRFRTPSLRNVALTAPYGHAGAYDTLEEVVRHHLDPAAALDAYRHDPARFPAVAAVRQSVAAGSKLGHQAVNPARAEDFKRRDGWAAQSSALRAAIAGANELEPRRLSDADVADIVAFLEALTDPRSRDLSHLVPVRVPSGLPVAD